ncbi:2,3-dihydroxybenzoate-AMP ligase [Trema orientale]|uniref:2,3-dihydroxybenzoate-AMP ligase n=1 Tax=Trema orientale TaxID=63057 RepID=A0A2P5FKG3_TREOI|nr:2,3-dihydroxybenzoate-AMP ligase [Trema orientale]
MEELKPSPANSSPLTPLGFLERAAIVYGDSTSVVYNNLSYTWSQTHTRCLRVASSIGTWLGVRRGQVVSVIAPNVPAMYELHFAVPMAGAILNNINTRLNADTVSVMLRHSESKLVFVDQLSVSLVLDAVSLFPQNTPIPLLVLVPDATAGLTVDCRDRFFCSYENLVEKGDETFRWVRPTSEWDPMVLNYTSGTTSSPKGVVHCHRALFIITVDSLVDWGVPKQPVYLWTLPMFHSNGWSYPWGMAAVGATNVCLRRFDGQIILSLIRRHRVTHMCAAPVVLNMVSNSPSPRPLDNPVHVMTGGAPPPAAVLHRTESLGFVISHGYGLTEVLGVVVSCSWKREWNRLPATERARLKARQGVRTAAMTDIDVVDPSSGISVKRDGLTMGEIVLRGGCVMLGYLKDPAATAKCVRDDGWFYTGDMAVMHPDGYLEIKDRSKDVIISGGENVSSVEVESALYSHPAVDEAAVVARPDEFWGETPCAFVTLKNGTRVRPTEKEIVEYCREKLPHYMVPKAVVFRDELPKTSTGKIQKFVLKEIAKRMGYSTYGVGRSRL